MTSNLTDVLKQALVGKIIRLNPLSPQVHGPFTIRDVLIDEGGRLVLYADKCAPIIFENPVEFVFESAAPTTTTRTIAALTVTEPVKPATPVVRPAPVAVRPPQQPVKPVAPPKK